MDSNLLFLDMRKRQAYKKKRGKISNKICGETQLSQGKESMRER